MAIVHEALDTRSSNPNLNNTLELLSRDELITRIETLQQELELAQYKATHDELTGLHNTAGRKEFLETQTLDDKIILFIDGNNTGLINKRFGHEKGDYVIQQMANILQSVIRKDDFISREGGDEFVIITDRQQRDGGVDLRPEEYVTSIRQRIEDNLEQFTDTEPSFKELNLGIAVGGAYGGSGVSFDELRHMADLDMKEHKSDKKRRLLGGAALITA